MVYINISGNSLEIIQTAKGLFAREEKITACSRKIYNDADSLMDGLSEALKTAYPAPITQKQVRLVITDKDVTINRFPTTSQLLTSEEIIEKAKKILQTDLTRYENFYKEIKSESQKSVLFTALPLSTIKYYLQLLAALNLKLNFLSTSAFSIYALLKPQIHEPDLVLYADYTKNDLNFILLDSEGPLEILDKKTSQKTVTTDLKSIIKKFSTDKQLKVNKLFLAGEKSLEVSDTDFSTQLELPVVKMSAYLQDLAGKENLKIDTGGVPLVYFDRVIGLINLSKMTDVPNFAVDLKNAAAAPEVAKLASSAKIESTMTPDEESAPPQVKMEVAEEKEVKQEEIQPAETVMTDNIVEYRKSAWSSIASNKIILIGLFLAIALILFGGFLIIGTHQVSLPFMAAPTPTPTVTPSPTITPTPTVDPSLKRSDLKLKVLNGTDKTGFAKETAEKLTEKGYKTVEIGNADRNDYASTVIKIKDDKKNYLTLLKTDLMAYFDTSTVETLPSDSSADAEIIIAKK